MLKRFENFNTILSYNLELGFLKTTKLLAF